MCDYLFAASKIIPSHHFGELCGQLFAFGPNHVFFNSLMARKLTRQLLALVDTSNAETQSTRLDYGDH